MTTIGWIISARLLGRRRGVPDRHRPPFRPAQGGRQWTPAGRAIAFGAVFLAGVGIFLGQGNVYLTIACLFLAITGTASAFPVFWQLPLGLFAGTAAAVGVGNHLDREPGRIFAPTFLEVMKDATGTISGGLLAVAAVELRLPIVFVPHGQVIAPSSRLSLQLAVPTMFALSRLR